MPGLRPMLPAAALALAALAAEAQVDQGIQPAVPPGTRPRVVATPIPGDWRKEPSHSGTYAPAISSDGRLVVLMPMLQPANQLLVLDLETGAGWRLAHPNRALMLSHAALAPDGRRLAVVVGRPDDLRPSELWLVDVGGGPVERVAAGAPFVGYPAFSPDGKRVAYFRGVGSATSRNYALFEYDLSSRTEKRLQDRAFQVPCGLTYAQDDAGLFYCAIAPVETDDDFLGAPSTGREVRAFQLRADGSSQPLRRPAGMETFARVIGLAKDGQPILWDTVAPPSPANFPLVHRFATNAGTNEITLLVFTCSPFGAGSGSAVIAAEADCSRTDRAGRIHMQDSSLAVVRSGRLEMAPLRSFKVDSLPRVLVPPADSVVTPYPIP